MKTAATNHSLNDLTTAVTAFRDWNEFAQAMHNGYTPTLQPVNSRRKSDIAHNALVAELAYRIESLGFRVWRGTNG